MGSERWAIIDCRRQETRFGTEIRDQEVQNVRESVGIVEVTDRMALRREFPHVLPIHLQSQTHLPHVAHASNAFALRLCPRECWQEHRRQNGDDGYYYEQLNQSESATL